MVSDLAFQRAAHNGCIVNTLKTAMVSRQAQSDSCSRTAGGFIRGGAPDHTETADTTQFLDSGALRGNAAPCGRLVNSDAADAALNVRWEGVWYAAGGRQGCG